MTGDKKLIPSPKTYLIRKSTGKSWANNIYYYKEKNRDPSFCRLWWLYQNWQSSHIFKDCSRRRGGPRFLHSVEFFSKFRHIVWKKTKIPTPKMSLKFEIFVQNFRNFDCFMQIPKFQPIFAKFWNSGLKMPNFPSLTGDIISVIPSDFLSNTTIPDEKSPESAPPPTVNAPPPTE